MKRFLRWAYKKLEKWLFDETYAEVDAERTALKLEVERLEDELEDEREYQSDNEKYMSYE